MVKTLMGDSHMDKLARHKTLQTALACYLVLACCNDTSALWAFSGPTDNPVTNDSSTRKGALGCDLHCDPNPFEQTTLSEIHAEPESKVTENSLPEIISAKAVKEDVGHTKVTLAQWVSDWMKSPRKVTAKLAIDGVVPEIELEAVIPAAQQKICEDGKCYEVDENAIPGKPCDQSLTDGQIPQEEPIRVAPVAPPVPPSFPFALQRDDQESSVIEMHLDSSSDPQALMANDGHYDIESYPTDDPYGHLSQTQVSIPASMLVAYMVAHAQNTVRLEMTEQLAAERAMYAQRYELLLQHNQQLQNQLAVLEARQQSTEALALRASGRPSASTSYPGTPSAESVEDKRCQSLTATKEDWDAIQEDLSNIRQQIAILKKSNPVPFATSSIGNPETVPSRQPQAWRTARSAPYIPVFPSVGKPPETTKK
jgi:hypothetical protein